MPPTLEKELETYRRELPKLKEHVGKYVLIREAEVLGTWSTYEDAIQEGYRVCGLKPFLVKKIEVFETVHFNSRSIDPSCQPSSSQSPPTAR
jgi:hypothetical protein